MTASPAALLAPLVARGVNLSLDAMREALHACGDPQLAIPCVHVAGTNGKGSVAAMTHEALRASGIRAARYTSPHLHRVAERFVIDDEPVAEDRLCDEILWLRDARDRGVVPPLSFFEALTLIAWRLFAAHHVEVAVMEVGVGGRLDATNLCAPVATAITRIALDHTAWLGDDLASIAREKAGILKPSVPCVLGPALREGAARDAIDVVARAVGAPLIDAELPTVTASGALRWPAIEARPALEGAYQRENASVAVALCNALRDKGLQLSPEGVAAGVARARWPGRMERVGAVLLDAAHNPDGMLALVRALAHERVGAVIFGASRDKDLASMRDLLAGVVSPDRLFVTAAALDRAATPSELAALTGGTACASPAVALAAARGRVAPGELVVACGSIFLVAAVRAELLGIASEPPIAM